MSPRLLLIMVLMLIPLSGLGVDLYTPSLPAIASQFSITETLAKMTISLYLIGFSVGQITFGTVSDIFGRRYTLIAGLMLFVGASLGAAMTNDINMLYVMRALQGVGAASASAIAKTLLTDTLEGKELTIAATYMSIAWAVGPIIAPMIGGYLQFYYNWHANFLFYTAYSSVLLVLAIFYLIETHPKHKRTQLDMKTIFSNYKDILSHRQFVGGIMMLGLGYGTIIIFNIVGPFLVQVGMGYNALTFGHIALFVGSAYFVGTIANRILLNYLDTDSIIRIGLIIKLIVASVMVVLTYVLPLSIYLLSIPVFLLVVTQGLTFPNYMSKCMSLFPERAGIASALMGAAVTFSAFILSLITSAIKSTHLMPTAWEYLILAIIITTIYAKMFSERRRELPEPVTSPSGN